jgi:hypothetical protein
MGENLKSIVAKAFKHHSNAAIQRRLKTPDLFSETPFIYYHHYRCRATNGSFLSVGDVVAIVLCKHRPQVWLEAHAIGEIEGDEALEIIEALEKDDRAGNCILARVEDEIGVDGRFSIMLMEEGSRVTTEQPTL